MREARALAAVDHPGVVRVRGTGEHEDMPWIAMDYVNGIDLKRVIAERGPMRAGGGPRYAIQAAEALVAAHRAGVIHRDLKPSNLAPDGRRADRPRRLRHRQAPRRRARRRRAHQRPRGDRDSRLSRRRSRSSTAWPTSGATSGPWAASSTRWSSGPRRSVGADRPRPRRSCATSPTFPPCVPNVVGDIVSALSAQELFRSRRHPRAISCPSCATPSSTRAVRPPTRPSAARRRRCARRPAPRLARIFPPAPRRPRRAIRRSLPLGRSRARPFARSRSRRRAIRRSLPLDLRRSLPPRPPSIPPSIPSVASIHGPAPVRGVVPAPGPLHRTSEPHVAAALVGSIRVAPARGRIKGTAVRAGLLWFAEAYGEILLGRVYDQASPELRALLRQGDPAFGIMASGWYETPQMGELLDLLERVAAPDDSREFATRAGRGRRARQRQRRLSRALPPHRVAAAARGQRPARLGHVRRRGDADRSRRWLPARSRRRVRGWSHHHPTVCLLLRPFVEQLLRSIGYSACVVERAQCVDHGDGQCLFTGNWLP